MGAMRNGGKFWEDGRSNLSLISCQNPDEEGTGRPAPSGYKYNNDTEECVDGGTYGGWVRLTDDCRSRLLSEFKDVSNLDELKEANKGKKVRCDERSCELRKRDIHGVDAQLYRPFLAAQGRDTGGAGYRGGLHWGR